jgi:hypothetical protein
MSAAFCRLPLRPQADLLEVRTRRQERLGFRLLHQLLDVFRDLLGACFDVVQAGPAFRTSQVAVLEHP